MQVANGIAVIDNPCFIFYSSGFARVGRTLSWRSSCTPLKTVIVDCSRTLDIVTIIYNVFVNLDFSFERGHLTSKNIF